MFRSTTTHVASLGVLALALGWAWPVPAAAGGLYKCHEKSGVIAYTNKPQAYGKCTLLAQYLSFSPKGKAKGKAKTAKISRVAEHRPISTLVIGGVASTAPARMPIMLPMTPISTLVVGGIASTAASIAATSTQSPSATDPRPAPPQALAAVETSIPKRAAVARLSQGWVYEDSVHGSQRADFSTITAGVDSTAATLSPPTSIIPQPSSALARSIAAMAASGQSVQKVVRGSVYRVKRKDGITEYTNVKPHAGPFAVLFTYIATCIACDVHSKINFSRTALHLGQYDAEIASAATEFGVDSALLRAVIHAESAFNPMALSNKGAQGLMQLMPATAGELGVTNAFDVAQNIRGGARYLAILLHDFNGNTQLATAAYNAGANAVLKYGGVPPYDETRVYVQRVETLRNRYQEALLATNDARNVHTL